MDKLPLVKSLVENLADNLDVPVSWKIRVFARYNKLCPNVGRCWLLSFGSAWPNKEMKKMGRNSGPTRISSRLLKMLSESRSSLTEIFSTGLEQTSADGILSAESLLENPALFAGFRTAEWEDGKLDQADLLVEHLNLCEKYPVPWRIIRGHVHKLLGEWFRINPHVRDNLNAQSKLTFEFLYDMVGELGELGVRIPPLNVKGSHVERVSANGIAA
ncbi:unnamed protein product [Ilex paraguariensis]|uniref:Uncharacterized protein n=1 Tax=Ilex paraguariensis TaxID=185542 RepID=A0ABC8QV60_9AQUA